MTAPQLEWVEVGRGFLRDTTARFELWHAPAKGCWVSWDFGRIGSERLPTVEAAKDWCEKRIAIRRAA